MTIQRVCELFNEIEINVLINESKKVILRNQILKKAHLEFELGGTRFQHGLFYHEA